MKPASLYIVEDELLITVSLKNQLENFGYTIAGAATRGETCLKELQELKEKGLEPEIVLMDIHIRGDMDGIETARRVTEKFDCGIIFITGQSSQEVYHRSISIKPFGYLLKPIDLEQTIMTIEIAAHQRALSLQNRQYHEQLVRLLDERTQEKEEVLGMYQALLDNPLIGLMIVQDGRFIFVNHQASRIFGYSREEFLGFDLDQITTLLHPEDHELAILLARDQVEGENTSHSATIRGFRKNGQMIYLMAHVKLITYRGRPALHQSVVEISRPD